MTDKKYIFPKVVGRLGNNLSIIAHAYVMSKEKNCLILYRSNSSKKITKI